MKLSLSDALLTVLPEMSVHAMYARAIDLESLAKLPFAPPSLGETEGAELIDRWKKLYKSLPCDKAARSSIEYLIKCARKGKLRPILPPVDVYNMASLLAFSPFGGENVHTMRGGLTLDCAKGGEPFVPLGKDQVQEALPGEVIWVDGARRVVCRAMNWIESDLHKLTAETRDIIFVSERPSGEFPSPQPGFDYLADLFGPHCERLERFVLDASNPAVTVAV
ncbi:B3/B4 domain-containing protein [Paludibacterium paludis]|uniref:B3/B4 tRNA-binding domain-containing protein n=1 Tax=Paludibacterium paludis TaxID=1225769 RepID=A0A918NZ79_9NEIS|nr:phenylalanine--tRNA ligase beta subunit-related protein [Paludibacterium paludis]GGY07669.1 hypothetical protein GCM10011289_07680 [Paludibacterium paludis]